MTYVGSRHDEVEDMVAAALGLRRLYAAVLHLPSPTPRPFLTVVPANRETDSLNTQDAA